MKPIFSIAVLCTLVSFADDTGHVISNAHDLAAATYDHAEVGRAFDITARLSAVWTVGHKLQPTSVTILDASGGMHMECTDAFKAKALNSEGAIVRVCGHIGLGER